MKVHSEMFFTRGCIYLRDTLLFISSDQFAITWPEMYSPFLPKLEKKECSFFIRIISYWNNTMFTLFPKNDCEIQIVKIVMF